MKKRMLWYVISWLPAFIVSMFFNSPGILSIILQLFFGVLMLVVWSVNTGIAAYRYPRGTMALILFYFGVSTLVIRFHYTGHLRRLFGEHSVTAAGIFSYVPLDFFLQAMLDFNIQHEIYIVAGITILCLIGWLMGMLYRWHNPNPYRPKIRD